MSGSKDSMQGRRDRLYARYLTGEEMTAAAIARELGIGDNTAREDLIAVRRRYDREVIAKASAKASELIEAGIDMTEPSSFTNAELLKFKAYAEPPVTRVKADVNVTLYTGKLVVLPPEEDSEEE